MTGTLEIVDGRRALRFERRLAHPVERVWRAVTEPAELARWFVAEVAWTPTAGETFEAYGERGRITVVDPPRRLAWTWGVERYSFELTPDGDGTVLVFTQLLSHQSVAARNGAGWHHCLVALDDLLGAGTADDIDWQQVYQDYLERIGPELGVPVDGGGVCWERATHVLPDRVREATTSAEELEAWGAADHAGEPLRWEVLATDAGTTYRLTHEAVDGDADRAAALIAAVRLE
jgi:uncharacterized protein YndB with AHSA1/START domain